MVLFIDTLKGLPSAAWAGQGAMFLQDTLRIIYERREEQKCGMVNMSIVLDDYLTYAAPGKEKSTMDVTFWGTRGSIPVPLTAADVKHKLRQVLAGARGLDLSSSDVLEYYLNRLPLVVQGTAGGNTACVEVRAGDQMLILDAGSGLRSLGLDLLRRGFEGGHQHINLLITHTHWDHIQGFPFFVPAFNASNEIVLHSPFPDLGERMAQQQQAQFFPVALEQVNATISFHTLVEQQWQDVAGFRVYPFRLSHPGGSYGYRVEDGQTCLVYATDGEYQRLDPASTERYVQWFADADLLIFDAQYSLTEALDKQDWGHSSAIVGAEFARRARAKRLALFHHDPTSSDEKIWAAREQASAYLNRYRDTAHLCKVLVAYDGLHIEL